MKTYREVRRTSCPSRSFDGLEVRRTVKGHLPLALFPRKAWERETSSGTRNIVYFVGHDLVSEGS